MNIDKSMEEFCESMEKKIAYIFRRRCTATCSMEPQYMWYRIKVSFLDDNKVFDVERVLSDILSLDQLEFSLIRTEKELIRNIYDKLSLNLYHMHGQTKE